MVATNPPRRADLDMGKGLAILLVVFGHLVARQDPQHLHWYEPLRRAIYAFHMPFFMYLSGFAAALSGVLLRGRAGWAQTARARAQRLLLPFFSLGLLVLAGKLLASPILFVDNRPAGIRAGLLGLFWHTAASPALSIWYLFVLFVVSLATLWLLNGQARRLSWLLAAALALYALPLPAYIYLDRVGAYAPFFLLGAMAGLAAPRWERIMDRLWPLALALLLAGLAAVALWGQSEAQKSVMLPLGALSLPALHGLLRCLNIGWLCRLFLFFGRYSFMIYLGNTICIGLAKAALLHFLPWDAAHFGVYAAALMTAGMLGPVMVKRHAFRRVKILDRLTG
ncbi:acyltransferase [Acidocella sp.]|uniref:acyltransferase family protein n=1 Tax=Acidocella sp. TaxID=50710 RepID=UPI002625BC2A|nr:acyltransferase [Acidocella sp.]